LAIEYWDEIKQRWILYRSQEEHHAECEMYPYDSVPSRIFLDTNVVNVLVSYPGTIFEHEAQPELSDVTLAEDIEALTHLFYVGQRANWSIIASSKTLEEIGKTPDLDYREQLKDYAVNLISSEAEENAYASLVGRRMIEAPFTSALPDLADRELLGNAIGLQCDVFCTRDRRTIIKKRDQLRLLPIRIMTPLEWWRHVKPWAGLVV
jgi:hypothetical protein